MESHNDRHEKEQKHLRGRALKEKELTEKILETLSYVREVLEQSQDRSGRKTICLEGSLAPHLNLDAHHSSQPHSFFFSYLGNCWF